MDSILLNRAIAILLCLGCLACSKEPVTEDITNAGSETEVSFTICSDDENAESKATASGSEAAVTKLDVLVFEESGELHSLKTYQPGGNSSFSSKIKVSRRKLRFFFIANAPASVINTVYHLTDLNNLTWFFDYNKRGAFVMEASVQKDLNGKTSSLGTIKLKRQVCKVSLLEIRNSLPQVLGSMTVRNVFLQNVSKTLGNKSWRDSSFWRHDSSSIPNNVNDMICTSMSKSIAKDAVLKLSDCSFYALPNNASEAASVTDKDYVTKLVIEIRIGSRNYYYPIALTDIQSNSSYTIMSVSIKKYGSTSPDEYIPDSEAMSFDLQIDKWSDSHSEIITI